MEWIEMGFRILGTGSAAPEYVMPNEEWRNYVDTSDEWIISHTGVQERRICTDENMTDLCVASARAALENAGVTAQELDLILCSTMQGQYISPAQACVIQKEIGASCPAFDINAACSGFIYALDVADCYFARGRVKKVLVVAMENMPNLVDWSDRATCVLFGDGGGAVVLGEGDDLLSIHIGCVGNTEYIRIPNGASQSPITKGEKALPVLYMNGRQVYKFAVNALVEELEGAVRAAGLTEEQLDWIIPHQANIRIIETAMERLHLSDEKFANNIQKYGNTSSGCIPLALDELNRSGRLQKGQNIALVAFGGGFTTGGCVLRWNR